MESFKLTDSSGFYKQNPGTDVSVTQMIRKTTDKSRGIRLGNYVQIRTIEDEELEAIASMEEEVAATNAKYNELFEELLAERAEKEELQKNAAMSYFTEGMVATDAERFKVLAEGVSYESVEDFAKKLETIKESYFAEQVVRAEDQAEVLEEEVEEVKTPVLEPSVSAYVASLNKFSKS